MQALISIKQSVIGSTTIQTVNARDLHGFLEVPTRFNDWIVARIEEYGFTENQDYVGFTEKSVKPQGGRPGKEYALSLDMAKELSMVERNARGKQARQYFIECERQAKQAAPALPPLKQAMESAKIFATSFRLARLIGCDKNAAAISANQCTRKQTGVDWLADLGQTHLLAANQQSLYYTPTELGLQMGGLSGQKVNQQLAWAGLQTRIGEHWQPTESARDLVRIFDTGKRRMNGSPIQQMKWLDAVIPMLRQEETA